MNSRHLHPPNEVTTMKAVIFDKIGGPEVLRATSVSKPVPRYGEVLIRVKACALNRLDYYLRIEKDDAMPMPHILGSDVAGDIATLGEGVIGWKVGDPVLISPAMSCGECKWCRAASETYCPYLEILGYQKQGGYAEYVCVPARNLIPKPATLTYEEASSIPLVFVTTYHQLITRGDLKAGNTVLVMGGSSGIGSAAVQLCKAVGARVIATVGDKDKEDALRRIGADVVVDHTDTNWHEKVRAATKNQGVDLVCEHFGGDYLSRCIELLACGGRLVTIGYSVSSTLNLDLATVLRKQITISTSYVGSRRELLEVVKLIEWGYIKPVIDKIFPLDLASEAHKYLESRRHFGKIVLSI